MLQLARSRYKSFTRRAAIVGGVQAVLMTVLAGRLYYLQVIRADDYRTMADDNRISMRLLPPKRGRILDRQATELANNQQNFRIMFVPEHAKDGIAETLDALSSLVEIDEYDRRRIEREIRRNRKFMPVTVLENLSWEEFSRVNVHLPDLPGIQPDVGESRSYPLGTAFAHLVGYVGVVAEKELTGEPLLELPGFRIGKSGVEKARESVLRGTAGNSQIEVNALGRVIKQLNRVDGDPGEDVVLTIDAELQMMVMDRLGNESASVVVMDVHTGDVISMVSTPGFDPNSFNLGINHADWKELLDDPRKPLINKPLRGQYPPGSTFKMIVALAALESGAVTEDFQTFCSGKLKYGNHTFHCWKKHGHGLQDMVSAIEHSCDVYFYEIARKTGINRIAAMAERFGLGDITGIGVGGERSGLVPTKEWKLATIGEPWQGGETLNVGIGQGHVLTTPLQLAMMTAQLANGGKRVRPRLMYSLDAEKETDGKTADKEPAVPEQNQSLGLSEHALSIVLEGMRRVTNSPTGTAFRARIKDPAMAMSGKSGTAQVRRISKYERDTRVLKNKERAWRERDHALFVAFAPVETPRYAISVVVEHGGGGSSVAGPIARDILEATQKRDPARTPPMGVAAVRNQDKGKG
ncbi:MAG: penicillin-binding protein 2 [Alphaproteobacteria bacterium]|jgi:penicillin-binding protein 2|nr:penicillin-binding protein 2 [Alphaproteobacteria bacterium]MBT4019511.1 penicillin-binding protein 2 [Alphaproteobacteria bacterium]MBT4967333.1 penicillin-binding protein 2 [Alphaproteobacteria bacterium]MBT5920161.1 penicillin-binding protein 2 [Alphaproteobacteria bacterium]MBT6385702.1 penicillin-binding protein 2 [Alphaproteobacteria bacterium]